MESSYVGEVWSKRNTTNEVAKAQFAYFGEEENADNIFNKLRNAELERSCNIIKDSPSYLIPLINELVEA